MEFKNLAVTLADGVATIALDRPVKPRKCRKRDICGPSLTG